MAKTKVDKVAEKPATFTYRHFVGKSPFAKVPKLQSACPKCN